MAVPIPRFRNSGSDAECNIGRQIVIWRMEFSGRTKLVLFKIAEDEALAGETLCGIANEKLIGHTAHEAIAATSCIQPQQVIAKQRPFSREKLSDRSGSHGWPSRPRWSDEPMKYLCGTQPSSKQRE
jgi:hypothetical protein